MSGFNKYLGLDEDKPIRKVKLHEIGNTKDCNCLFCQAYADASESKYLDMMARNERSAMTEW